MNRPVRQLLNGTALAIVMIAATSANAFATHFRYGTLTWQANNPAQPNVITFRMESAWRRDFPWNIGHVPVLNDIVPIPGVFCFGNGICTPGSTINAQVTGLSVADNWIITTYTVNHTYANANGVYQAYFTNCCRISNPPHMNNADKQFSVWSNVTINMTAPNRPPTSSLLPIVAVPANVTDATFSVPAVDADGDVLTFRLGTAAEMTHGSDLSAIQPSGLTLDNTGTAHFNTVNKAVGGMWSAHAVVTDTRGATAMVDFLLLVVNNSGVAPTVRLNNSVNPLSFNVPPGGTITFDVEGVDPDLDPGTGLPVFATLTVSGKPATAILNPSLPVTGRSPVRSTFTWTPALSEFGTYNMTFGVTDNVGLQDTNSVAIFVQQNRPPAIAATASPNPAEATSANGAIVTLDGSGSSDPDVGDTLTYSWTEGQNSLGTTAVVSNQSFSIGNHTVTLTISDGKNPPVSKTIPFVVRDTTAPTIGSHADETVEATSAAGAVVTYAAPATHDAVGGDGVASCTPASGTTFGLGRTRVTCTAQDGAGNNAADSVFDVVVADTTAPTIDAHADVTAEATSAAGAVVSYSAPATHDAVGGDAVATCSPASGATFGLAHTVVTCQAQDTAGNSAAAVSFDVFVADTIGPTIEAHANVTAEATSAAGATVSYTSPATHDAVGGDGVASCSPASGTTFGLGHTVVTCQAQDAAGNAAAAMSFDVFVADTTAPTIGAHANVTAEATSAAGVVVSYLAPATHDAVGGDGAASCSPASGATFALGRTVVTCQARDAAGNNAAATSFDVFVGDTKAPTIQSVTPSQATLWPPNHKMVPISLAVSATDAVSTPVCQITSVSSNQPLNGTGDGNTTGDWRITGALTLELRSERSGGTGARIYTIGVRCTDGIGNASTGTTAVSVPHDQGK